MKRTLLTIMAMLTLSGGIAVAQTTKTSPTEKAKEAKSKATQKVWQIMQEKKEAAKKAVQNANSASSSNSSNSGNSTNSGTNRPHVIKDYHINPADANNGLALNPAPTAYPRTINLPVMVEGEANNVPVVGVDTLLYNGKHAAYQIKLKGTKGGAIYYVQDLKAFYLKDFCYTDKSSYQPLFYIDSAATTTDLKLLVEVVKRNDCDISTATTTIAVGGSVIIEGVGNKNGLIIRSRLDDENGPRYISAIQVGKNITVKNMKSFSTNGNGRLMCTGGNGVLHIEASNVSCKHYTYFLENGSLVSKASSYSVVSGFQRLYITDCGLTGLSVEHKSYYDTTKKQMIDLAFDGRVSNRFELSTESEKWISDGESTNVYDVTDSWPSFPGGAAAQAEYLKANTKYPAIAQENNVQGRVIVQFIVEADGYITNAKVVRSVDPSLDKEALRVIKAMPQWIPAMKNGQKVRVKYVIPVSFYLE